MPALKRGVVRMKSTWSRGVTPCETSTEPPGPDQILGVVPIPAASSAASASLPTVPPECDASRRLGDGKEPGAVQKYSENHRKRGVESAIRMPGTSASLLFVREQCAMRRLCVGTFS